MLKRVVAIPEKVAEMVEVVKSCHKEVEWQLYTFFDNVTDYEDTEVIAWLRKPGNIAVLEKALHEGYEIEGKVFKPEEALFHMMQNEGKVMFNMTNDFFYMFDDNELKSSPTKHGSFSKSNIFPHVFNDSLFREVH